MAALIRQLALVSELNQISAGDVQKVSAAIQKQASRDLAPIWDISATVDSFDKLETCRSDIGRSSSWTTLVWTARPAFTRTRTASLSRS